MSPAAAGPGRVPAAGSHTSAVHAAPAAAFDGEEDDFSDPRPTPLTCRDGYVQIGYTGRPYTDYDWYGLYSEKPNKADWSAGLVTGQWEWATKSRTYLTNQDRGHYYTAYWTQKPDGKYSLVSTDGPDYKYCKI